MQVNRNQELIGWLQQLKSSASRNTLPTAMAPMLATSGQAWIALQPGQVLRLHWQ